ncbi:MFS transporter [Methanobacterium alcaliphilum]|uniref:MFS transporter n=1 Tax=Methanobacterium alcaliphilum TaxID=392018 RepID=UPI00200A05C3|nr:MFS transporter [Methanobacterium alcaliphilum]MCK9151611.1 MFS transporter [Methanobacterium alcaliphilum]
MRKISVKHYVLIIAALSSFLTPFMGSSVNVALPAIASQFQIDAIIQNWIPASFLLAAAIFAVPFGRISEILGMKKIFTYGIILFTISSFLAALSPDAFYLIIFRVMQGIGSAMIFVTGLALLTRVYPPQDRGKAIGINIAVVYIGLSLGPVLGGILTQNLGWQSIFWFAVPIGLLTTMIVLWKLKDEWADARGEKFDVLGSILYSIALFLLMYGFSLLPAPQGLFMLLIGVLLLFGFVKWELSNSSPVFNMKLFKNFTFAFSSLAALINYSATFAVSLLLSYHLQYINGLDQQTTGFILIAQPLVMAIVAPLAGRLSDKKNPQVLAGIGMSITTLGLFLLAFIHENTSLTMIILSLMMLGLGFGLFSSPNTNAIMGSVERKYYGIASATVSSMRLIGQSFSIGMVTLIFAYILGRVQISPEYYHLLLQATQICFILFSIMCFVGIFAALAKRNHNNKING